VDDAHGQSGALPLVDSLPSIQHEWYKPSIAADLSTLNASLPERHHQARLLAVSINAKGSAFLNQLGRRLSDCTGNMRETSFLF